MRTFNKTELNTLDFYEDESGQVMIFVGYRNKNIAVFHLCDYNEVGGYYYEIDTVRFLTPYEVKRLKTC